MIGILGKGHAGNGIAKALSENGFEHKFLNIRSPAGINDELHNLEYIFISVYPSLVPDFIAAAEDRSKIIEASSVKTNISKFSGQIISIDPIFLESGNKQIAILTDISRINGEQTVRAIFKKHNVVPLTIQDHAESILFPRVCSYIMAMMMLQNPSSQVGPLSYKPFGINCVQDGTSIQAMRDTIRTSGMADRAFIQVEKYLKKTWNELSFY
ncbi:MAG: hypothetical protein QW812_05820 [Thermoplasmataceae archaeon]